MAGTASPPVIKTAHMKKRVGEGEFRGPQHHWWKSKTSWVREAPGPQRPSCLSLNKLSLKPQTGVVFLMPHGEVVLTLE